MQNQSVPKSDTCAAETPRFTAVERIVLASGAFVLSAWIGGLAWIGYKLVALII